MEQLTKSEKKLFRRLNSPVKIQNFLETIPINFEKNGDTCMSPRRVLKEHKAHCIEGALLAAAIFQYHGQEPLIMDLKSVDNDDDHVVALFRQNGYWGAISKTNHAVLRYREPIYKTFRELAMSYFHEYFMNDGKKTLRSFSRPFSIRKYDKRKWVTDDKDLWYIAEALDESPHISIVPRSIMRKLRKTDPIEIKAGKIVQFKK